MNDYWLWSSWIISPLEWWQTDHGKRHWGFHPLSHRMGSVAEASHDQRCQWRQGIRVCQYVHYASLYNVNASFVPVNDDLCLISTVDDDDDWCWPIIFNSLNMFEPWLITIVIVDKRRSFRWMLEAKAHQMDLRQHNQNQRMVLIHRSIEKTSWWPWIW